jgi:ribosome biogenesis GTPase / thiamine phosphate phosphatase
VGRDAARIHRGDELTPRRDYDEDDVRVRPGRRNSRPRTKERPRHADAAGGFVTAVDRGRYTCLVGDSPVLAMRARELGRGSVVVGDEVALVGDMSGQPGSLARIVRIEPRRTLLRRTADDNDPYERVVVANADQLVIVTALANPPPRTGLIDRCLAAGYAGGLEPLLCLTKSDLATPDDLLARYAALGLAAVSTRRDSDPADLRERLTGRVSVLVGHSGVGKSTLVNKLVPDADRSVGVVSAIGKGRHTSTSVVALALPESGWVIDTPGIRSFGLAHVTPDDLLAAFPDLDDGTAACPPHCEHLSAADGCALDAWVTTTHADPARLDAYRRLLRSRATDDH